jgi:hypothetical protein
MLCGKSKRGLYRTDDVGRELSTENRVEANTCRLPRSYVGGSDLYV